MLRNSRPVSRWAIVCAALLIASVAAAQARVEARRIRVEDPSGVALAAFHRALARTGEGRARATIWGASHVASDQYPGFLREALQRRHGDGGPGFVLPAMPFSLYAHRGVRVAPAGGWRAVRVRGRHRAPDAYGPFGVALDASGAARARAELVRGTVDRAVVYFMRQPGGGTLDIVLQPGGERRRIDTSGVRGAETLELRGAIRALDVRAIGDGPVRLFGVSLERERGVIVDSLGIPGSRLGDRLPWDDVLLRPQVGALAPDLIVLAYGTNESGRGRPLARVRRDADEAVRRARALAPDASCLLIGPSDWPDRASGGGWAPRARTTQIVELQRELAARHGCGFFDLVALQGGPGLMPRWVEADLALDDHVHFTDEGHRIIARILSRALMP
jgi:lysophospholipase L1-like esterase